MTRQDLPVPAALLPVERWCTTALACLIVVLGILMLSPSRSTNARSPADHADRADRADPSLPGYAADSESAPADVAPDR